MSTVYNQRTAIAIALITAALMSTEVILTRIFSVIIWYHFAFLAISVALFGTGVASVLVHVRQHRLASNVTGELLAGSALAMAVVIAAVDLLLINVTPDWFALGQFTDLTLRLAAIFMLAAAPFFFGGVVLSLAMTRYSEHIHRLYFWDLVGAACGCIITIPLLSWFGGPGALLVSASIAGAAAIALWPNLARPGRRYVAGVAAAVYVGLFAVGSLNPWLHLLDIRVAKGVNLREYPPEFTRWNSFSMVTVFPNMGFRGWGISPRYTDSMPEQRNIYIDMHAMTPVTRFSGLYSEVRHTYHDLSALVYRHYPRPRNVCIIGAGGGKDVLAALVAGSKHVTAVEINPIIVNDVVKGKYRDFSGNLYGRKEVSVHIEDGRSFVRRSREPYDVILLSMVDTSAATASGAYAMTENGLYTSDAFKDFISKLAPGGILSVSTVSLPGLMVGARLASLAREALMARGSDPSRSVTVVQTPWLFLTDAILNNYLIKPDGFSDDEIEALFSNIQRLDFDPAYLPGIPFPPRNTEQGWIKTILTTKNQTELETTMRTWPVDVSSIDDNRPFFFYMNRLQDLGQALMGRTEDRNLFGHGLIILSKIAAVAVAMVCLFLLLPVFLARHMLKEGSGSVGWDLGYVACLGMGFMFIEIALIQRLLLYLGNPTYTFVVVLFVLLLFGGIGSRLFSKLVKPDSTRPALLLVLGALIVYSLALGAGFGAISRATGAWVPSARALFAALMLAPLGLMLGMPFPTGLSAIAKRARTRIPWLWSINSATSVLGSVLATITSLQIGIPGSIVVGALLYGCAALLWLRVSAKKVDLSDA